MMHKCIRAANLMGLAGLTAAAVLISGGTRTAWAAPANDPKAEEVARQMMQAMGGEDAWNAAHFVRFDFKVKVGSKLVADNHHLWDRKGGRYRLERLTKDGKHEVDLFNIGDYERSKAGLAYLDGKVQAGEAARKLLEDAYGSYINDSWWLSMPWKWFATGVNLKYLGTQKRGKESDDEVQLTFDHVGLTPGDLYHAFVSRDTHLMTHWDYILQSHEKGAWDWQYGTYHGVKLASNHTSADHKDSINMGDVRVLDAVDDSFFTDPAHSLPELK